MFKELFLAFCGLSFGLLSSAGVFTVFSAVGLVPRFAGKTHSAKEILLYENMIVAGTIIGGAMSIWPERMEQVLVGLENLVGAENFAGVENLVRPPLFFQITRVSGQLVFGLFSGMFVGCFALSIAEMLDSIPIFTRRISFRKGIGLAVCSVAAGKLCGALFYFVQEMYQGVM